MPAGSGDQVPDVGTLPPVIAHVVEHAYGSGIAEVFLLAAPLGLVALVAVALMREVPLGTRGGLEIARDERHDGAMASHHLRREAA
jgi:hypothetical protein